MSRLGSGMLSIQNQKHEYLYQAKKEFISSKDHPYFHPHQVNFVFLHVTLGIKKVKSLMNAPNLKQLIFRPGGVIP